MSFVVVSSLSIEQAKRHTKMDSTKGSDGDVLCCDTVMSLYDLEQYDIFLSGLIHELSTMSDELRLVSRYMKCYLGRS